MKSKLILTGLLILLAASSAQASALITKGANEVAVSGTLDFQTDLGTEFHLNLKYAYFVMDRVSVGTKISMHNNRTFNHFGLGLTAEYNFRLPQGYEPLFGTDLVPYVGGSVEYRHAKVYESKDGAVVFGGEGGVKFFLTDTTAVTLALVGEVATDDVFADDNEATNLNLMMLLGMRFYF